MKLPALITSFFVLAFLASCSGNNTESSTPDAGNTPPVPAISYSLQSNSPHDTTNFTEGLEFYNNMLLESTGLEGKSRLIELDPQSNKITRQVNLDPKSFGEGITVLNDTLYQLTWQQHIVNVYTVKDFRKVKELPLNYEGWGLTNDGKQLIASDGSSNLYFYQPETFKLLHVQEVTENGTPAVNLNELEYINGFIYANQWQYNYILKIDPSSGWQDGSYRPGK
jgi:glutaminyl-peptide cyclotransferase